MSVDILRVESNERVDIADFEFISEAVQAHERQMIDNFMCDPARTRKWVLSGFAMSNPAAKQLQVAKGKAILGSRIGGSVEYGVLTTEGDVTLTVDLNSYSAGTYGIYVRFERIAGESQSRIFWNPSGAGSEYAQAINTRWTAAWALRVEATNPGAEWLKIGEVDQATMAITDQREFYFEGSVDSTYESGWSSDGGGSANDRNSDRATYGCADLQMMLAALRQAVEDVKGRGLKRWWDQGIGGMNIGFDTDPTDDTLAIEDANFNMTIGTQGPEITFDTGDHFEYDRGTNDLILSIGASDLYAWGATAFYGPVGGVDLGTSGLPWDNLYVDVIHPTSAGLGTGVTGDLVPSADGTYDLGASGQEWQDIWIDGTARIDVLLLSDAASEGVASNLFPFTDGLYNLGDSASGIGSGSNRRFNNLFLDGSLQIEKPSGDIDIALYVDTGPADEKWWQIHLENSTGSLSFKVLDDSYANPDDIMVLSRTGAAPNQVNLFGTTVANQDSGWSTAPYDPAVRLRGINPYLHFDDNDTGIHADHRDWGMVARQGTGDVGQLEFLNLDTAGTSEYAWLVAETAGGANTRVDYIYLNAYEQITLTAGAGTNNVVAISADGGSGPSSSGDLGLTSDWELGAAGSGFSIVGTSVGSARTSTGFLKIWVNGTARYVPFFDNYN